MPTEGSILIADDEANNRHLLRMLKPLHPGRILVFSNHCGEAELAAAGARKASSLEELLAQSDIFHSLAGLTPRNLHRIGAEEFALLKNGAVFVNAGRAGLTMSVQAGFVVGALASAVLGVD